MFGCALELAEASCVSHSLGASILEPGAKDLVLVKGKTVEVYRVREQGIELHGVFDFASKILACARLPRPSETDRLILRFAACKVRTRPSTRPA